jgi:Uma2 family endonuclease
MQTAATGYELVLDPDAYAGIELLAEDNIPVETFWHRWCMNLLIEVTAQFCQSRPDYWVGGNNFIYFNPDQARNLDYRGPDYFYIKDGVDRSRPRDFWAVWRENGRTPDVIIELLSPTTAQEDRTTKFQIYEQTLRVPEYFLYDHDTQRFEGWRLNGGSYAPLPQDGRGWLWSAELGLWLGNWVGEYLGLHDTWLRMYTTSGELVPTTGEAQRQLVEKEKQRAELAEKELARLRALLHLQPPPKTNGSQS